MGERPSARALQCAVLVVHEPAHEEWLRGLAGDRSKAAFAIEETEPAGSSDSCSSSTSTTSTAMPRCASASASRMHGDGGSSPLAPASARRRLARSRPAPCVRVRLRHEPTGDRQLRSRRLRAAGRLRDAAYIDEPGAMPPRGCCARLGPGLDHARNSPIHCSTYSNDQISRRRLSLAREVLVDELADRVAVEVFEHRAVARQQNALRRTRCSRPGTSLRPGAEKPCFFALVTSLDVARHARRAGSASVLGLARRIAGSSGQARSRSCARRLARLPSFRLHRHALAKSTRSLSRNGTPRLQAVRHAQLVLDHEQPVQERLGLEVERVVDVILGRCRALPHGASNTLAEDVARAHMLPSAPDRREHLVEIAVWAPAVARRRNTCRYSARSSDSRPPGNSARDIRRTTRRRRRRTGRP